MSSGWLCAVRALCREDSGVWLGYKALLSAMWSSAVVWILRPARGERGERGRERETSQREIDRYREKLLPRD